MDMYNQNGVSTWMGFTFQSTNRSTGHDLIRGSYVDLQG